MADLKISLNTDNDAFYDDENLEVARILRNLADKIENNPVSGIGGFILRDINGNSVGDIEYQP
jgi:hypothetical protein